MFGYEPIVSPGHHDECRCGCRASFVDGNRSLAKRATGLASPIVVLTIISLTLLAGICTAVIHLMVRDLQVLMHVPWIARGTPFHWVIQIITSHLTARILPTPYRLETVPVECKAGFLLQVAALMRRISCPPARPPGSSSRLRINPGRGLSCLMQASNRQGQENLTAPGSIL